MLVEWRYPKLEIKNANLKKFQIYPNSSVFKSKALIINNYFSESEFSRTGTEVDEKNLFELFGKFNYDVLLKKDASAEVENFNKKIKLKKSRKC